MQMMNVHSVLLKEIWNNMLLDFVLGQGASYMEDDIRGRKPIKMGFCRDHYKKDVSLWKPSWYRTYSHHTF